MSALGHTKPPWLRERHSKGRIAPGAIRSRVRQRTGLARGPLPSSRSVCGSRPLPLRRFAGNSALFQKPNANLFAVYADQLAPAVGDAVRCKQQEKFLEVEAFNTA